MAWYLPPGCRCLSVPTSQLTLWSVLPAPCGRAAGQERWRGRSHPLSPRAFDMRFRALTQGMLRAGQLLDFTIEVENDESESKRMAGQHQNGRMEGRRDEPVGLIGHHFVPQGEQSPRPRYAGQYNGTPTTPRPQVLLLPRAHPPAFQVRSQ